MSSTRAALRCDTGPLWSRSAPAGLAQTANNEGLSPSSVCVCLSEGGGTAEARHIQASSPFVCSNVRRRQGHSPRHATTSGPPPPEGSLGEWRGRLAAGLAGGLPSTVLALPSTCPLSPLKIWAFLPSDSALFAKDGWPAFKGLDASSSSSSSSLFIAPPSSSLPAPSVVLSCWAL